MDRITHEIVDLVNRTFVTSFDRDDMYRLAGALDDVCDHVDEAVMGAGATKRLSPSAGGRREHRLRLAPDASGAGLMAAALFYPVKWIF